MLLLVATLGLAAALSLVAVLVPQSAEANRSPVRKVHAVKVRRLQVYTAALRNTLAGIHARRDETWKWQDVMSVARLRYGGYAEKSRDLGYRRSVLSLWAQRAAQVRYQAQHPPRLKDWLCIHRYEGSWTDPNPPYYGGLQMDMSFMRAYGGTLLRSKGTADHWSPLEQIWVAERAFESGRGFYPWPNTARWCGLL